MSQWQAVLELDHNRTITGGSEAALCDAVRNGADLRVYTEFRHNEHIDVTSDCPEIVQEAAEFRVTCLLDDRWVAGFMTLRQPIALPDGFGPRASMSYFLYNQNGQQAIGRLLLDGVPASGTPGASPLDPTGHDMPKYHPKENWDSETNAPSQNFIYDFETYRFYVRDGWQEVLSHSEDGTVLSGSVDAVAEASMRGCEIKVGIRDLCRDLAEEPNMDHEWFVQTHSNYYYTEQKLLITGTQPLVRLRPAIPLTYTSGAWDCGWLMVRTDGFVSRLLYDPYLLRSHRSETRHALRWFVR
jgi:hypothetical protein